jgi:hypothetical protein
VVLVRINFSPALSLPFSFAGYASPCVSKAAGGGFAQGIAAEIPQNAAGGRGIAAESPVDARRAAMRPHPSSSY